MADCVDMSRMYCDGVEIKSDDCGSVLHKLKSWLLEAAEQHKNKTHNKHI